MAHFAQDLALAEEHVAEAKRHVARQKDIVAELDRDGHPTEYAQELLRLFEKTLQMHIEHRDHLIRQGAGGDSGLIGD